MKDRPSTSTGTGSSAVADPADAAAELLAAARGARQRECAAAAEQLALACAWADLHPAESLDTAAGWTVDGTERAVPLAGAGTPWVAEFCVAELTTVLGLSPDAGRALLGEALELRHRLPKVWARVQALAVPAWRARRIARATMVLTPEGAAFVDGQVAHVAHRVGAVTVDRLVEEATARFDPDRAKARREARAEGRFFHVNHTQVAFDGTSTVYGVLDLADALDLNAAVTARAGLLAALGSEESLDVRRAAAVGEIARAELTLDLHTEEPEDLDRAARVRLRRARRDTTLVVHLSADALTLARGTGCDGEAGGGLRMGRVENTRTPVTVEQIREWLAVDGARVMVRPVLDLDQHIHVARYEIPDRLADQTRLRDNGCVFPWCERPARTADIDHVVPHGDGGETATDNTATLCRRHHRLKTHGRWRYRVLDPGTYLWISPHGHTYLRDHTGTRHADTG